LDLSAVQIAVLKAVRSGGVLSPIEEGWAIKQGFARQSEEGDISLTTAGRESLADSDLACE